MAIDKKNGKEKNVWAKLSSDACKVFIVIWAHQFYEYAYNGKSGSVSFKQSTLRKLTGLHEDPLHHALIELVMGGLISYSPQSSQVHLKVLV